MAKQKKTSKEVDLDSKELSVTKQNNDPVALMKPAELSLQIAEETKKRSLITEFIKNHLKSGTDYGKIHISKTCPNKYNCTNSYHFSKDVLFKPGAEKFCSLFKLRAEFKKDTETWEMLGSKSGELAYLCRLYTTGDVLVGEGRGVASVIEKGNSNTAVKIAEKRAKLDAVLSTGALSDFFTQDLEDMQPSPVLPQTDEAEDVPFVSPARPSVTKVIRHDADFLKSSINRSLKILAPEFNKDNVHEIVKKMTGLDLSEDNYQEIEARLLIKLSEMPRDEK